MKLDETRELISTHPDFHKFFRRNGFGCRQNVIRAHTNYTIQHLRTTVPQGLDSITIDNIRRKARNHVEGYIGWKELEDQIKWYKKICALH